MNELATIEVPCPQCGGPMEQVDIDGRPSWSCPVDAYAFDLEQDVEYEWPDSDDEDAS